MRSATRPGAASGRRQHDERGCYAMDGYVCSPIGPAAPAEGDAVGDELVAAGTEQGDSVARPIRAASGASVGGIADLPHLGGSSGQELL